MRLKSIETVGFKSFADNIEVNFDGGITAIVGPNGSGKSNISDAISWVLGEQSVKTLRSNKMQDVIFSGTSKRRALGMAQVTLILDNSDQSLPIEYEEVSLSRRIYKSGESSYYLNNKNCRLKDITTILADTGLGKGSMSIIGQNKIDEILNSRPEERRSFIEEAAGISKFKIRKKDAMRKLESTADNIVRIYDIKAEAETRLEPLKLSSEKTEKFNLYSKELETLKINSILKQIECFDKNKHVIEDKLKHFEKEVLLKEVTENKLDAVFVGVNLKIDELNVGYNDLKNNITQKSNDLEKLKGQTNVLSERIIQNEKSQVRLNAEIIQKQAGKKEYQKQINENTQMYDKYEKEYFIINYKLENLNKNKIDLKAELNCLEKKALENQNIALNTVKKNTDLKNKRDNLANDKELISQQRNSLKIKINTFEKEYALLNSEYDNILSEQASLDNNLEILLKEINKKTIEKTELDFKLRTLNESQNVYSKEEYSLSSRVSLYEKMEKEHDGFGIAIKKLFDKKKYDVNLLGVVAELINVEPKYVIAIETALGNSSKSIVSKTADSAKKAISFLKANKYGRATFLPLDIIKSKNVNSYEKNKLKEFKDCFVAVDLIKCDDKIKSILEFLLGRVLIAPNINIGLELAKSLNFKFRVVTIDGDVVNAGGALTGGAKKQNSDGYLSRKKKLVETTTKLKECSSYLLTIRDEIENYEARLNKVNVKLLAIKEEYQKSKLNIAEINITIKELEKSKSKVMNQITELSKERNILSEKFIVIMKELKETEKEFNIVNKADDESKKNNGIILKDISKKKTEIEFLNNDYNEMFSNFKNLEFNKKLYVEKIRELDNKIKTNNDEIENINNLIIESKNTVNITKEKQLELNNNIENIMFELSNTTDEEQEIKNKSLKLIEERNLIEEKIKKIKVEINSVNDKKNKVLLEKTKLDTEEGILFIQLDENHNITIEEAKKQEIKDFSIDKVKQKTASYKIKIENLGAINPNATQEYNEIKQRCEFLNNQYEDLCLAKEEIEKVVFDIDHNMSIKFKEAFIEINKHFNNSYQQLFSGGNAKLELEKGKTLLETGINISVQPPGKKTRDLYSLSGGERSLTVIALLFGLLSYKPSPFCILDEIDAALDETNIDRFSNFLNEFTQDTQFIIITHRKGTMEVADIIYGITMEESGVSKLLSVKLEEKRL